MAVAWIYTDKHAGQLVDGWTRTEAQRMGDGSFKLKKTGDSVQPPHVIPTDEKGRATLVLYRDETGEYHPLTVEETGSSFTGEESEWSTWMYQSMKRVSSQWQEKKTGLAYYLDQQWFVNAMAVSIMFMGFFYYWSNGLTSVPVIANEVVGFIRGLAGT